MQIKTIRAQQAFSLVELLIVVAIIAIITGIAVPNLLKAYYQAKDKKVMTEMRSFAVAIGLYNVDTEIVPNTNDMTTLVAILKAYSSKEGDMTQISETDAWGHRFYYRTVVSDSYTLKSFGKDGQAGNLAGTQVFDPDADTVLVNGVFVASHQGATAVMGQ